METPLALRRSRREVKPKKLSYWEEYVTNDPWYCREMLRDVPKEEVQAALVDSDFSASESDDTPAPSDSDYSPPPNSPSSSEEEEEEEDATPTTTDDDDMPHHPIVGTDDDQSSSPESSEEEAVQWAQKG